MKIKSFLLSLPLIGGMAHAAGELRFTGEYTLPTGTAINNIVPEGLSSLAWDNNEKLFYAINDNRNNEKEGQATLYSFRMGLTAKGISGVDFLRQYQLLDREGKYYPAGSVDAEGLALTPDGKSLLWSSELGAPLRLSNKQGIQKQDFTSLFPPHFNIGGTKEDPVGVRSNTSWESVTFSPDGKQMFMAVEGALKQDGSSASALQSGTSRILKFSNDVTGSHPVLQHEYLYITDPVPQVSEFGVNDNGIADILAISDNKMLVVERSGRNVTAGFNDWDFNVRVYIADLSPASDISSINSLNEFKNKSTLQTVRKKLLLDFSDYTTSPDCIEGVTFGPEIDGKKTLIFVSDNNKQKHQNTKFYLFIDQKGVLK